MRRAVVIGASVGGLVAAAQLRADGWAVTLLEKGRAVGGLYATVVTPFGPCELGMHVLYVTAEQQSLLAEMFGTDAFIEKRGFETDIGAAFNHGRLNLGSMYPDLRAHPERKRIVSQLAESGSPAGGDDAAGALGKRFGPMAAAAVAPILEKLWKQPAGVLAPGSLHCYYDLRRILVADKAEADVLKQDPRLDAVVGNPLQSEPAGEVFGGRRALFFRSGAHDLSDRALAWLRDHGITVELGSDVCLEDGVLKLGGRALAGDFEACIVSTPLAALDPALAGLLDQIELSILYFKTRPYALPAYYVLCHDPALASSRIVNYAAYNFERMPHLDEMMAVEVLHEVGKPPDVERIRGELSHVLSGLEVVEEHVLPRRLKIPAPTLANAARLDALAARIGERSGFAALHFAGMRTDRGVFFSHQTIGAAHAAALDCSRRLP